MESKTRKTHGARRAAGLAIALSLSLFLLPLMPLPATAGRRVPRSVCRIDWRKNKREVKKLIRCATERWHVRGGARKAIRVAICESGLNPRAYGNGNGGVFQQRIVYWKARARQYGMRGKSVYNGRANIIVSIRMAHNVGWGPWSCA